MAIVSVEQFLRPVLNARGMLRLNESFQMKRPLRSCFNVLVCMTVMSLNELRISLIFLFEIVDIFPNQSPLITWLNTNLILECYVLSAMIHQFDQRMFTHSLIRILCSSPRSSCGRVFSPVVPAPSFILRTNRCRRTKNPGEPQRPLGPVAVVLALGQLPTN